ncbi:MAG: hypothetical protein COB41_08500 [Proteobacteria bacterium]|nr:MAG: hypothetical protein COB41_08500 [Pseudomonadota bacterium]
MPAKRPLNQVELLLQCCRELGIKLRTAESCTAGAVAARLASVSGASDVLDRGWITYSNQAKTDELDVPEALLLAHGAVSETVVRAMAEGAAKQQKNTCCIAISGIAGPNGGTDDKPVGTVWMAVCFSDVKVLRSKKFLFQGSRDAIQIQAVDMAVNFLLEIIQT